MYNPAEANSVKEQAIAREIFQKRGIRLEQMAVSGSNEILQAVQILANRDIQVVWLPCCLPPTRNEVGILIYGLL